MVNPDPEKNGLSTQHPATHDADRSEPHSEDYEDKEAVDLTPHKDDSASILSTSESVKDEEDRTALQPAQTYATAASAATEPEPQVELKKKAWYKYYNPLRWSGIPPVPEERTVSREYNAPFLSLVYFQWIAPLMSVSLPNPPLRIAYLWSSICPADRALGWLQTANRRK